MMDLEIQVDTGDILVDGKKYCLPKWLISCFPRTDWLFRFRWGMTFGIMVKRPTNTALRRRRGRASPACRRPGKQPAHAVPYVDAVDTALARHRPLRHREVQRSPRCGGTTLARDYMRGRCSVCTK
ncbi:hypothetical protein H7U20_11330 [Rugamonas sp. CCM 8940]|nr:hypothetical protein [Rugamonas sp. CCM 8940]